MLPGDIEAVYKIYQPFIGESAVTFETTDPGLNSFGTRVLNIAKKYPFLVAVENGLIAGYAYACEHRSREAYRWTVETSVYIAQSAQNKGIGTQLYQELFFALYKRNYKLAYALITIPNESSVALHRKLGFTPLAVHKNAGFKSGAWHDVLWMEYPIGEFDTPPKEPE